MGFIRFLLWTSICVGLGIYAATYQVDGKTPVQHIQQIWNHSPAKKMILAHEESAPTEQHSEADRDAINRLVAKRSK
jgi:hypothetical protein